MQWVEGCVGRGGGGGERAEQSGSVQGIKESGSRRVRRTMFGWDQGKIFSLVFFFLMNST